MRAILATARSYLSLQIVSCMRKLERSFFFKLSSKKFFVMKLHKNLSSVSLIMHCGTLLSS